MGNVNQAAVVAIKFWNIVIKSPFRFQSARSEAQRRHSHVARTDAWTAHGHERGRRALSFHLRAANRPPAASKPPRHRPALILLIVTLLKLVQRRQFYHSFARRALRRKVKGEGHSREKGQG
jgi:hypothetical protein